MLKKAALVLMLPALVITGCRTARAPSLPALPPGEAAPDFELADLEGNRIRLSQLVKDGPVLLNFWATWCGPCVRELPELDELSRDFAGRGLTVVGVSLDANPAAVRQHLARAPVSFLVLLDREGNAADMYGVSGIPHNLVIGTDMTIRFSKVGYAAGLHDLRRAVREVLEQ